MTNSVMRGAFLKDANLRREFLSLMSRKNQAERDARPSALCQPAVPAWTRKNWPPS